MASSPNTNLMHFNIFKLPLVHIGFKLQSYLPSQKYYISFISINIQTPFFCIFQQNVLITLRFLSPLPHMVTLSPQSRKSNLLLSTSLKIFLLFPPSKVSLFYQLINLSNEKSRTNDTSLFYTTVNSKCLNLTSLYSYTS